MRGLLVVDHGVDRWLPLDTLITSVRSLTTLTAQGGGEFWVLKRVPTAVRLLQSSGCRDASWLKKGGCPLIILYDKGAVRVFASNILTAQGGGGYGLFELGYRFGNFSPPPLFLATDSPWFCHLQIYSPLMKADDSPLKLSPITEFHVYLI